MVFCIWQPRARDSGNKITASAHGMGAGGLAVDAMAIGCLGVDRRAELFFSYLAILRAPNQRRGIWNVFAKWNFWIKNLNKTPLNFLKQSSQVNNFTVFFQFFIGM